MIATSLTATAAGRALCRRRVGAPIHAQKMRSNNCCFAPCQTAPSSLSSWQCSSTRPNDMGSIHRYFAIISRPFSVESSPVMSSVSPTPTEDKSTTSNTSNEQLDNIAAASEIPHKSKRRRRKISNNFNSTQQDKKQATALPPLTEDEYDPEAIVKQVFTTSKWKQHFNYEYVRLTVDDYERHLRYVLDHIQQQQKDDGNDKLQNGPSASLDMLLANIHPSQAKCAATHKLLSPKILANAIRSLLRTRMDTPLLSQRIRDIERLVGLIGWTPITEELSYRLLEANGKAGNVKRTLALLELRRRRGYIPREQDDRTFQHDDEVDDDDKKKNSSGIQRGEKEFIHAIQSIQSAQLPLRRSRNIYTHESSIGSDMALLDNPTRYLDAILLNMSQRNVPLRPEIATQMLNCYASTGRTGRALHYFYKVVRDPVEEDGYYIPGPHPTSLGKEELGEWKDGRRRDGMGRFVDSGLEENGAEEEDEDDDDDGNMMEALDNIDINNNGERQDEKNTTNKKTKPRMIMHPLPPFHKIPSHVEGANLTLNSDHQRPISFVKAPSWSSSSSSLQHEQQTNVSRTMSKTKYEWEVDREWSLSLTAAFAFADSLTHGACGHDPIELNVGGWNCLVKACCYRGAFHRALKILNETMPQKGIEPDSYSYNTILAGLARVGDISSLKEYLMSMTNKRVRIDKYTVQAMADGFLNVGDISGASTMVQDIFNQHDTLPPYTTHLKIIEFALSNGLIFEAKRHVYFIQQLWKWEPSKHHDKKFIEIMEATKHNPKLSRESLKRLFRHFSEDLRDEDFF